MAKELSEIEEESEGSQKVPWTVRRSLPFFKLAIIVSFFYWQL